MPPILRTGSSRWWRIVVVALFAGAVGFVALSSVKDAGLLSSQPRLPFSQRGVVVREEATAAAEAAPELKLATEAAPALTSVIAAANTSTNSTEAFSEVALPLQPLEEAADTLLEAATAPAPVSDASLAPIPTAELAPNGPPAVAFLFFTIDGSVSFPEVWAEFFAGASDELQYSVIVHRSDNSTGSTPASDAFMLACRGRARLAAYAEGTAWGQLIAASRSLAAAALDDPNSQSFVYVSATTLPVKSFTRVYQSLMAVSQSSSFCLSNPRAWVRSHADPSAVFPKHAQWFILARQHAQRFADLSQGNAVAAVDQMCGGSWRQCYPATSEELVMAAIVGKVSATAMGSDWLEAHPSAAGGPDEAHQAALQEEEAAGEEFFGGPVQETLATPGVNGGAVSVRDEDQTNRGVCTTWHWWDDYPNDAQREPSFRPLQLFAERRSVSEPSEVEALLEQHVDRFWAPLYHPQELGPQAMTEELLLEGLCASEFLFARKFGAAFSLRPAHYERDASGADYWACSDSSPWRQGERKKLGPRTCGGMRPSPILGLEPTECKQLCCAMGPDTCTAWQYRGHSHRLEYCWLGHAQRCTDSEDHASSTWHGERLVLAAEPPVPDVAQTRGRVLDAFRKCFQLQGGDQSLQEETDAGTVEQEPPPEEAPAEVEDVRPLPAELPDAELPDEAEEAAATEAVDDEAAPEPETQPVVDAPAVEQEIQEEVVPGEP